jgi:hypothetical protein
VGHFELHNETHHCGCNELYYLHEHECKLCSDKYGNCKTCDDEVCLSCHETFLYNNETNTCYCGEYKDIVDGKCEDNSGLSALAIIAIIVGILALAGGGNKYIIFYSCCNNKMC